MHSLEAAFWKGCGGLTQGCSQSTSLLGRYFWSTHQSFLLWNRVKRQVGSIFWEGLWWMCWEEFWLPDSQEAEEVCMVCLWGTLTFPHRHSAEVPCPVWVCKASSAVCFVSGLACQAPWPAQLSDFCQTSMQSQQHNKMLVSLALGLGKWLSS